MMENYIPPEFAKRAHDRWVKYMVELFNIPGLSVGRPPDIVKDAEVISIETIKPKEIADGRADK